MAKVGDSSLSKRGKTEIAPARELNAKEKRVETFNGTTPVVKFKGQHMIRIQGEWQQLTKDLFETVFYKRFGGMTIQMIRETYNMVLAVAPDVSHLARYLGMPDGRVWDCDKAVFTDKVAAEDCIYRAAVAPDAEHRPLALRFLLDVANGDENVMDDIIQSMAPLALTKKPSGVIWWQGVGRNGKTATMDVIYKLFPGQLSGLTLKQLEDERDTPVLNGKLGNIVRESSEGVIDDSRTYKSVGTHENFFVHKFNQQDMVEIDGSLHHIFSTNNMPIFSDKSDGARRRTLIVQFKNRFADDPTFEEKTFTKDFLAGFLQVLLDSAAEMRDRRFQYAWSDVTKSVKEEYDKIVNTAETFAAWCLEMDVAYFTNFTKLRLAYDWWCDNNSYTALGKTHLRNAILSTGFKRSSIRASDGRVTQIFRRVDDIDDCHEIMPGLYAKRAVAREDLMPKPEQGVLSDEW